MKKLIVIVITVLLLCGFRTPNSNIISKGDLADKLIADMGEPHLVTDLGMIQARTSGRIASIKREV